MWHYQPNITKNVCCLLEHNRKFCYYLEYSRSPQPERGILWTHTSRDVNLHVYRKQHAMDLYIPQAMRQHTIIGVIICLHHKLHVMNLYISDYTSICEHTNQSVHTKRHAINFSVINIYIPEDVYYQHVHHTTGNTSTTAYQKWHISTHTRQQKANILNLMVPDVTESLINIPTRRGTLINLQILEQTFL